MLYLIASICFILALWGLSSPKTAHKGHCLGIAGMTIAIIVTLASPNMYRYASILSVMAIGGTIGTLIARRISMTSLPQLVAAFHSLVGIAAVFVAGAALYSPQIFRIGIPGTIRLCSLIEMGLGTVVGAITFSGSLVAFGKLQNLLSGNPLRFSNRHFMTLVIAGSVIASFLLFISTQSVGLFWLMVLLSCLLGAFLILPIGGADMPVIVSMLNSYSGWAAAGIGFTMGNSLLIITGALVGSSGAILSYVMCKGMNRSILNVLVGGFGEQSAQPLAIGSDVPAQTKSAEEAAAILSHAKSVIIVPGYGMAVAQAQHILREMADCLKERGAKVRYAIHPVAGRMPGHMNVLLAEANVSYEDVFELEDINHDFEFTDAVIVIGANDITNPSAKRDPQSPIYGMPVLDVEKAKTVFFIKRSLSPGYAGIDNALFYEPNVSMVLGDGKKVCESIVRELKP